MPREIDSGTLGAVQGRQVTPIGLVALGFDSGWARFWTGIGELVWDGVTWYGAGALGKIGKVEETTELRAVGLELELSGVPASLTDADGRTLAQIALAEDFQGREALIYYGALDSNGALVGEPFQLFGGVMDRMPISIGQTISIVLALESDLIDLERTKIKRYTAESQRSEFPDDAGCDAVAAVAATSEVKWGRGFEI